MSLDLERRCFVCEYCTTIYFPEESPEGLRILDAPVGVNCPSCNLPLLYAWIDETQVFTCPKCRGLLVDQTVFMTTIQYLRARACEPPIRPRPLHPVELQRQTLCPSCGGKMDTHPYGGPGNVVVDNCLRCNLIWLDHGELSQISGAPGKDRGVWT